MTTIDLTLSPEQQELRETVAKFLQAKASVGSLRAMMETEPGFDRAVWAQLAEQLGLVALIVPEAFGGMGCGPVELALVQSELGRVLYSGPYLPTVLAVAALMKSQDDDACASFLPGLASGEVVGTIAFSDALSARHDGEHWRVDGTESIVMAATVADLFLVNAETGAGMGLFAVHAADAAVESLEALDLTRRLGTVRFHSAPAQQIGTIERTASVVGQVLDVAAMAVAAESAGAATQCLELSVEYAKTRVQFGAPIGSYQAVAHKCAEMLMLCEHARSAAHYAAASAAAGSPEFPIAAHAALAYTGPAFNHVATETIQVHGGIGFTWEHDAHLYYRRAHSSALLFGHADDHFATVATLVGL